MSDDGTEFWFEECQRADDKISELELQIESLCERLAKAEELLKLSNNFFGALGWKASISEEIDAYFRGKK